VLGYDPPYTFEQGIEAAMADLTGSPAQPQAAPAG
jgi:hypothetical protein